MTAGHYLLVGAIALFLVAVYVVVRWSRKQYALFPEAAGAHEDEEHPGRIAGAGLASVHDQYLEGPRQTCTSFLREIPSSMARAG